MNDPEEILLLHKVTAFKWSYHRQRYEREGPGHLEVLYNKDTELAYVQYIWSTNELDHRREMFQYLDGKDYKEELHETETMTPLSPPRLTKSGKVEWVAANVDDIPDDEPPELCRYKMRFSCKSSAAHFIGIYNRFIDAYKLYNNQHDINDIIQCSKLADNNCKSLVSGFINSIISTSHKAVPNIVYCMILYYYHYHWSSYLRYKFVRFTENQDKGSIEWRFPEASKIPSHHAFADSIIPGPKFNLFGIDCELNIHKGKDLVARFAVENNKKMYIEYSIECKEASIMERTRSHSHQTNFFRDKLKDIFNSPFLSYTDSGFFTIQFKLHQILISKVSTTSSNKSPFHHMKWLFNKEELKEGGIQTRQKVKKRDSPDSGWNVDINQDRISISLGVKNTFNKMYIGIDSNDIKIDDEYEVNDTVDIPYDIGLVSNKDFITVNFYKTLLKSPRSLAWMMRDSICKMDTDSLEVFMDIENNLSMHVNHNLHLESVKTLDLHKPKVLDALSQILIYCIKSGAQTGTYVNYFRVILSHIIRTLGQQSAVDGFIRCWIDDKWIDGNLYSFMHLVTKYASHLIPGVIQTFSDATYRRELVDAFVDVRATLSGESSLILAIKDKNQALIGYMLREIWNYHGNGATSALIFNNIVYSKFDGLGNTILHALISTKSAVLGYLIAQHRIQEFLTETDSIIIERFVYSIQFEKHFNRMGKFNGN